MGFGTAADLITKKCYQKDSGDSILKMFVHLTKGIKWLHERRDPIIHRDIKPANCLFDAHGKQAKIGDLGCAVLSSQTRFAGIMGTQGYMAPEIQSRCSYGAPSDIYSLGVTFRQLLRGTNKGGRNIFNDNTRVKLLNRLVETMMSHNSNARPTAKKVCEVLELIKTKSYVNAGQNLGVNVQPQQQGFHFGGNAQPQQQGFHFGGKAKPQQQGFPHFGGNAQPQQLWGRQPGLQDGVLDFEL